MLQILKKFWLLLIIFLLIIATIASTYFLDFSQSMNWGVTFSPSYARDELGLDWKETYIAILDDMKVDRVRLSAYWNEVEKKEGKYDYTDLDFQIKEASNRNVKIILAVGRRLPRWPECHDPEWIANMNSINIDQKQLKFVEAVTKRYAKEKNIIYWQVENEPYLANFGICPALNPDLFKDEIKLVKQITDKPILVTDSGELSTWWPITHSGGDILGTTLYRVVYNPNIGYFRWFTPPFFYWSRVQLVKKFTPIKRVIVAELQTESWHKAGQSLGQMTASELNESMSLSQLKDNVAFTRKAGFDEAYLWGVEWWYLMKTKGNDPSYWNEAKKLWQ